MDSTRDLELSALLLGALDPSRARIISAEIAESPPLQARLRALEAELATRQSPAAPDRWRVPVPWSASAGLGVRLSAVPTLDAARLGDVHRVSLPSVPDPETRGVLVLRREPTLSWAVMFPVVADDWIALSALETRDGARELMITATGEPGPQRWAVAFPPLDAPIAWDADEPERWAAVRALVAQAQIPIVSWEVVVEPPGEGGR